MPETSEPEATFRIVCLGGSAGGLQAYIDNLLTMPADTGMVFVIAPQRSPDNAPRLVHIMSNVTKMPVVEVRDGMAIRPNCVYIMPPRTDMTMVGNLFHLRTTMRPPG